MSYDELNAAFERVRGPVMELGDVYQRTGEQLAAAARVDADGSVSINEAVLRATIEGMAPPGTTGQYELLTEGLDLGFLVAGDRLVAPWSAFTRPEVYSQFDDGVWRSLGFLPSQVETGEGRLVRDRTTPFAGVGNVPDAVLAADNMAQLYATAAQVAPPQSRLVAGTGTLKNPAWALHADNMTRLALQNVGVTVTAPADVGTSTQALTSADVPVDKLKALSECLQGSQVGWDNPFVLRLCVGTKCADALRELLSSQTDKLWQGLGAVTGGLTAVVGALGGWVALAIILSAAYWAFWLWVAATPNGVCLHIPMPWTFGGIGPGWATGR